MERVDAFWASKDLVGNAFFGVFHRSGAIHRLPRPIEMALTIRSTVQRAIGAPTIWPTARTVPPRS